MASGDRIGDANAPSPLVIPALVAGTQQLQAQSWERKNRFTTKDTKVTKQGTKGGAPLASLVSLVVPIFFAASASSLAQPSAS